MRIKDMMRTKEKNNTSHLSQTSLIEDVMEDPQFINPSTGRVEIEKCRKCLVRRCLQVLRIPTAFLFPPSHNRA